jgi:intracellular sulfur oxidation DsrE/DsrF family protein
MKIWVTLRNRKLAKDQFIADATYVPSGVAEVTRLFYLPEALIRFLRALRIGW